MIIDNFIIVLDDDVWYYGVVDKTITSKMIIKISINIK